MIVGVFGEVSLSRHRFKESACFQKGGKTDVNLLSREKQGEASEAQVWRTTGEIRSETFAFLLFSLETTEITMLEGIREEV